MKYLKASDYYNLDRKYDLRSYDFHTYGNEFCKFILKTYENSREHINESNIDKILSLKNYDVFIDIKDEKNKKILLNMINNKILNCKSTIYNKDLKICGFDETTLKNALLHGTFYSNVINYMLETVLQYISLELLQLLFYP
jgi:hypothetical protein